MTITIKMDSAMSIVFFVLRRKRSRNGYKQKNA
jgi:hypothetical protein